MAKSPDELRAWRAAYMRKWRENNPRARQYQKEYNAAYFSNPENARANRQRASEWYRQHSEVAKERELARYHANKKLKGRQFGEKHHLWKGGQVGYHALHGWITRIKGRPAKCELCGTTKAKRFEWANRDHLYKRDPSDWMRVCTSCHRRHDYDNGIAEKGGPKPK